jgi:hypothetical protein
VDCGKGDGTEEERKEGDERNGRRKEVEEMNAPKNIRRLLGFYGLLYT